MFEFLGLVNLAIQYWLMASPDFQMKQKVLKEDTLRQLPFAGPS